MTHPDQQAALDFLDLLRQATRSVIDPWFLLPYAGRDPAASQQTTYRERVYCYELYHQIRKLNEQHIDERADAYELSAEIAKSGLDAVIEGGQHVPDFVWHVPGSHQNAVVMEIKRASRLELDDLCKDLQTLDAFLNAPDRSYACGILLVYGHGTAVKDLRRRVLQAADRASLSKHAHLRIHLLWHPVAGESANDLGTLAAISGTAQ
jgi:hypothetical protein